MSQAVNPDSVRRVFDIGLMVGGFLAKFTTATDLDDKAVEFLSANKEMLVQLVVQLSELFGNRQLTEDEFKVLHGMVVGMAAQE
jgi:hypothetical protein